MKFEPDILAGTNVITRHGAGELWVGAERHDTSLVLPWRGATKAWRPSSHGDIEPSDFELLLDFKPELVIFGSGARIRFLPPGLMRALIERRIGVETMDTGAACRTFNVLVAERRCVVAALLMAPRANDSQPTSSVTL